MNEQAISLLYRQAADERQNHRVCIFNAYADASLTALKGRQLHLQQYQRTQALALKQQGLKVLNELQPSDHDLALVLPSKQRQQTLNWLAQALYSLKPEGTLLFCCPNDMGAKTYEKLLATLGGRLQSQSKHKCRCIRLQGIDRELPLLQQWLDAGQIRKSDKTGFYTAPGVFGWNKCDLGSQLLLQYLPQLRGHGMDLGCGYGFLSIQALKKHPDINMMHLVDQDLLAIRCARENLKAHHRARFDWRDGCTEILPAPLDFVLLNPPFHAGKQRDLPLGQCLVQKACQSLKVGGSLYMVANRKLAYEKTLQEALMSTHCLCQEQGFKVLKASRLM